MDGIQLRQYKNYDEYIAHQKSKADFGTSLRERLLQTGDLWESDCEGFRENFKPYKDILKDCKNAMCLGARTGMEVFVLREMGVEDAIGIDLVETPPLVISGDVHDVKFEDKSFDFVFSNIFDHVLMPAKFISEIERISKPNSHCLLHLSVKVTDDAHAANVLDSSSHVIKLFKRDIEVLEDKKLNQPNWPEYWTLLIKFKD
jgi:SAM-dependent methyltransferase